MSQVISATTGLARKNLHILTRPSEFTWQDALTRRRLLIIDSLIYFYFSVLPSLYRGNPCQRLSESLSLGFQRSKTTAGRLHRGSVVLHYWKLVLVCWTLNESHLSLALGGLGFFLNKDSEVGIPLWKKILVICSVCSDFDPYSLGLVLNLKCVSISTF